MSGKGIIVSCTSNHLVSTFVKKQQTASFMKDTYTLMQMQCLIPSSEHYYNILPVDEIKRGLKVNPTTVHCKYEIFIT